VNVTASKMMLGVSLAALTYFSWDHIFPEKPAASAPSNKAAQITPAMTNKAFVFKIERDPFNSVPLGMTLTAETAAVTGESGKDLGELNLQGVIVTLSERAAVINGQTVREGQLMKTPTGATIRAKRVTPGYCIVEGGGRVLMLKTHEDAPDLSKKDPKNSPAAGGVAKQMVAGTNP
jgi:hypothetical protein